MLAVINAIRSALGITNQWKALTPEQQAHVRGPFRRVMADVNAIKLELSRKGGLGVKKALALIRDKFDDAPAPTKESTAADTAPDDFGDGPHRAPTSDLTELAKRLSESARSLQEAIAAVRDGSASGTDEVSTPDDVQVAVLTGRATAPEPVPTVEALKSWRGLLEEGVLTSEEFDEAKFRVLALELNEVPSPQQAIDQIRGFAELHQDGLIDDGEFSTEKGKLI